MSTSSACSGFFVAGHCPGDSTNQCCVPSDPDPEDTDDGGDDGAEGPESDEGLVPDNEVQQELQAADAADTAGGDRQLAAAGAAAKRNKGQLIYAAAARWLGTKYVFGGGACSGPTRGGFDCSGLVLHAVCKVTGKHLPHKAQSQYKSRLGKHIPRSQAKQGDTIYWARNGNCNSGIKHVGIVKDSKYFINAPHTGAKVRVQKIWTKSGSLKICPSAVRFW
jgi:cell wall-associated NlpC family hydrolase